MKAYIYFLTVYSLSVCKVNGIQNQVCAVLTTNCSSESQYNENMFNQWKEVTSERIRDAPVNSVAKRGATSEANLLWPNVKVNNLGPVVPARMVFVPYTISNTLHQIVDGVRGSDVVRRAIEIFNKHSCVQFVAYVPNRDQDYVEFVRECGCRSDVGRQGGKQQIFLDFCCWTVGIVLHEMMHTVGFYHEHNRPDRDQHVNVDINMVAPGFENNFNIEGNINSLGSPYDFDSIMHYGTFDFATSNAQGNLNPVIVRLDNTIIVSKRNGLSVQDIIQLNALYLCNVNAPNPPEEPTPENQPNVCPTSPIIVPNNSTSPNSTAAG